jgi:hypothetical protein
MIITIRYNDGKRYKGIPSFFPFLEIIQKYPFPKPAICSRTNHRLKWLDTKIDSFIDSKFHKYLEPIKRDPMLHIVSVDDGSKTHLNLSIAQKEDSVMVLLNLGDFLTLEQIKQLFVDFVTIGSHIDHGWCGTSTASILEKHFPNNNNYLNWIQYYGKKELEQRGGFEAFETNPYVQTQRIHDGLLVQVGNNPNIFTTFEGETLLVHAINALPLLKEAL